ncbi:deoxyribonuclease V [Chloroflexota bacterium]
MKVERLHSWQVSITQAKDMQMKLAARVSRGSRGVYPHFIAGVDISVNREEKLGTAAVVVLDYPEMKLVETKVVSGRLTFPYVPGLLSFRELPLTLAAFEKLTLNPGLVLVDGQGIAHPRRIGLASHLGLFLDTPTIGCAKSLLCGSYDEPGLEIGSYTEVVDKDEVIGAAVRTRSGVKPIYVSIGHQIDLQTAIHRVLECCRGYRLPEPTRLAHLAAGSNLRWESNAVVPDAGCKEKIFT